MTELCTPDGKTTYFDAGSGRPLVLLHAFPLSKAMWQPQLQELSSAARVLAPDLPGFGSSKGFDKTPGVEAMADRVAEFLDAARVHEHVVVGGLSMGGYVALAFARRYPSRLRALVLADTKADADDEAAKANRNRLIELVQQGSSAVIIEQMVPRLLGATTLARGNAIADKIRAIAGAQSASAIADGARALRDRPDQTSFLPSIRVPSLILVGSEDTLTPPAKAEELHRGISGAQLVTLESAGHIANLEAPERFNEAVRAFLEIVD